MLLSPSSLQLHSPSETPVIRLLHPPLLAQVIPRFPGDFFSCLLLLLECVPSPSFPHITLGDSVLSLSDSLAKLQLRHTCPQATEHHRRETQHLTSNVSLNSTEPLSLLSNPISISPLFHSPRLSISLLLYFITLYRLLPPLRAAS